MWPYKHSNQAKHLRQKSIIVDSLGGEHSLSSSYMLRSMHTQWILSKEKEGFYYRGLRMCDINSCVYVCIIAAESGFVEPPESSLVYSL